MPVGSFPGATSHYGTLDQAGNAWEWVETTVFDTQRVIRGGSMCATYEKLLPRVRTNASPTRRYPDTGFRVARAVPPEAPPLPQAKPLPQAEP
jgi:formylglycine-generating enzyme required for sulfatase activity